MAQDQSLLQNLADRFAIQDTLARYARGVDRRDWDFVRSAFHPGATVDQGDYKGDAEGLIQSMKLRHQAVEQSMHILTNCLIEFDSSDGALVETYYLALQRNGTLPLEMRRALLGDRADTSGEIDLRALGRYVDRFERRSGEWRIVRRICIVESITGTPAPPGKTFSANWIVASRDGDDALWRARTELGLGSPTG